MISIRTYIHRVAKGPKMDRATVAPKTVLMNSPSKKLTSSQPMKTGK